MATALHHGSLVPALVAPSVRRTARGRFAQSRSAATTPVSRRREHTARIHREARTREMQRTFRKRQLGVIVASIALALASLVGVFAVFGSSAAANGTPANGVTAPKYVVAQPGDTLWSIGERIAPNAAITEVVDELVRLNGTAISAGQLVRIP